MAPNRFGASLPWIGVKQPVFENSKEFKTTHGNAGLWGCLQNRGDSGIPGKVFQKRVFIQGVDAEQDKTRKQEEILEEDRVVREGIQDKDVEEFDRIWEVKARDSRR